MEWGPDQKGLHRVLSERWLTAGLISKYSWSHSMRMSQQTAKVWQGVRRSYAMATMPHMHCFQRVNA